MAEVEDVVQVKVELRVEVGKVSLTFCKAVSAPLCPSPQCAGRVRAPAALAPMLPMFSLVSDITILRNHLFFLYAL